MTRPLSSLLALSGLLFFAACSTPQHEDDWRYQAAGSTQAYAEYFLKEERAMTQSRFSHAERSARRSADLEPLGRLYLTRCALEHAVLQPLHCDLLDDHPLLLEAPGLGAYRALLNGSLKAERIPDLPPQYRDFAAALLRGASGRAEALLPRIEPLSSRLVAASLVRERLDDAAIQALIAEASRLGYRRAVNAWLQQLCRVTGDPGVRERTRETLTLLNPQTPKESQCLQP